MFSKTTAIKKGEQEEITNDQKHINNHGVNYHEQYINNGENQTESTQLKSNESTEEPMIPLEPSFISTALSDYDVNNLNITTTSLFSPSVTSLPNDQIQFTENCSAAAIDLIDQSSILICAYNQQQNQR